MLKKLHFYRLSVTTAIWNKVSITFARVKCFRPVSDGKLLFRETWSELTFNRWQLTFSPIQSVLGQMKSSNVLRLLREPWWDAYAGWSISSFGKFFRHNHFGHGMLRMRFCISACLKTPTQKSKQDPQIVRALSFWQSSNNCSDMSLFAVKIIGAAHSSYEGLTSFNWKQLINLWLL